MRYPLVLGNWKLHGSKDILTKVLNAICNNLITIKNYNVVIAPPIMYLELVNNLIKMSYISLGAQNVDINVSGSFTGDISANMLKDVGVKYVIIGHSERRLYHKETDELIAKKFNVLKNTDLVPVLCIGETEKEKITGQTEKVCTRQIDAILETLGIEAFINAVIAYEPIWAIGTGKSSNAKSVQLIHKYIRKHLAKKNISIAKQVIIQYGGSVNDQNIIELLKEPDIDGVLVGTASLSSSNFTKIIKASVTTTTMFE
ncbi:triose-phosphate isomerase [Pantoea sp. Mhis]|uniref:triose-phosphate isomerase n=1 Tax=Pantoea sp. Mhis TaxID=2576759 RepID=UPI00135946AF|nr:triose-phosphate isomerase [Pantoea sp. Mhis]MXP56642.1 triose-phosphate isomerase [Pantoea sp. Mhis]